MSTTGAALLYRTNNVYVRRNSASVIKGITTQDYSFIEARPEGFNASLGSEAFTSDPVNSRRIGIARALYKLVTSVI